MAPEEKKLTEKQLLIYRDWIREFGRQGLDTTATPIMRLAREQAFANRRPFKAKSSAPTKPFSAPLPWWAKTGLKLGGRNVVRSLAGPKGLALVGATIVCYATLCANDVLPHGACIHKAGVEKLLTEIGLLESDVAGERKELEPLE